MAKLFMLKLTELLEDAGIDPDPEMKSIILVGGMGTRLKDDRKRIDVSRFKGMSEKFDGQVGPKGLALLKPSGCDVRPLTDWHLEIHERCTQIEELSLALGCCADMMEDYYQSCYQMSFNGLRLKTIPEKNPAGTIAPLVKLYSQGKLTDGVYVYANGDNLADVDFLQCYREGMKAALDSKVSTRALVIDIAALVPWEESDAYGTLDMDFTSGKVSSFKEKGPVESNAWTEVDGKKMTPINSGFSIIVNPLSLFDEFLDQEVVDTSLKLEAGELDYKGNETVVKYETFYEKLAANNRMVAVLHKGYWTDLGTEEKIMAAEENLPEFFTDDLED